MNGLIIEFPEDCTKEEVEAAEALARKYMIFESLDDSGLKVLFYSESDVRLGKMLRLDYTLKGYKVTIIE